jgi:hypothetical protein
MRFRELSVEYWRRYGSNGGQPDVLEVETQSRAHVGVSREGQLPYLPLSFLDVSAAWSWLQAVSALEVLSEDWLLGHRMETWAPSEFRPLAEGLAALVNSVPATL